MESATILGLTWSPTPDSGAAATPASPTPVPLQFRATAVEYFRIWIVNTLLSVATLGIYSAWAKVRRLRYFYGNTYLDGVPFAYHASPLAILKGRLLTYGTIVVLGIVGHFAPAIGHLLSLVVGIAAPALIVRAIRFRNVNSSYRGIRFDFDGQIGNAYTVYAWIPALALPTLGLILPYVVAKQREFVGDNCWYGSTKFSQTIPVRAYYGVYARGLALLIGLTLLSIGLFVVLTLIANAVAGEKPEQSQPSAAVAILAMLFLVTIGASIVTVYAYVQTGLANLFWNNLALAGHRFSSSLRARSMICLYLTNLVAIAASVGVAAPWARVRTIRYRIEHLEVLASGALDAFAGSQTDSVPATGGEFADALGFDIGV